MGRLLSPQNNGLSFLRHVGRHHPVREQVPEDLEGQVWTPVPVPESAEASRCPTAMREAKGPSRSASRAASQAGSRPATGMSQVSTSEEAAKRKHLMDLKKKLMSALQEVDSELAHTGDMGSKSRSSTRNQ